MTDKEEKYVGSVSQQECEIAETALVEFNKRSYNNCLQEINKLENRTFDFKVAHNKIVVEYYKSDLKKTEAFQKNLNSLFNQFSIKLEKLDDVDHCVAHFNLAVVHFHNNQYTQTLRILERVYKFIEPMDETLAKQVGLLLVELQLSVKQVDKAMTLLMYLENYFANSTTTVIKGGKQAGKEQSDKKSTVAPLDPFKKKLTLFKARCYLMNHNLESFKKEIAIFQNAKSIPLMFLTANLEYLKGNHKESMNILDDIPLDIYNYGEHGESSRVMKFNNLAAVYHSMGKFNLAAHYFHQALKEDIRFYQSSSKDTESRPLYVLGGSKYHELIYNIGIALLHAGKPDQAFEFLIIAVRRYHRNARLWLRLAECCIRVHKGSNEVDFDMLKKQREMITEVIGSKSNRKVMLTKCLSSDKKYGVVEPVSYAVPVPTLGFGMLCVRNAYSLLPSDTAASPVPLLLIPGVTPPAPPLTPGPAPSASLSQNSVASLKNSILAAGAYIAICLGDYIIALEHAQSLLNQPKISGVHKLLGHLYSAEALVLMDKITEAMEHLNPENIKDISLEFPEDPEEDAVKNNPPINWFPKTMESVQSVIQYNIAVCKVLRGQMDQASALLKKIWKSQGPNCRVPAHIIMLVLYIELQLGHAEFARTLIKQYCFQYKISS